MGLYDEVIIPCPKCGHDFYAQSKGSATPDFRTFTLDKAPLDVLSDVNRHAPFTCEKCGASFSVEGAPPADSHKQILKISLDAALKRITQLDEENHRLTDVLRKAEHWIRHGGGFATAVNVSELLNEIDALLTKVSK